MAWYVAARDRQGAATNRERVQWSLYAVLAGHSSSVSALTALELPGEKSVDSFLVLTGGSDGVIQSWRVAPAGPGESYRVRSVETATDGSDSVLLQKFDLKGKIPLDLALTYLPSSQSASAAGSAMHPLTSCVPKASSWLSQERKLVSKSSPLGPQTRSRLVSAPIWLVVCIADLAATTSQFVKSLSLEGHTDWVRCLAFITPIPFTSTDLIPSASSSYDIAPGEVLLASGSQDNYIRLWRFARVSSETDTGAPEPSGLDALDELERTLAEVGGEEGELRVKAHDFPVAGDGVFACSSEAVLLGHDAWVTGLHWAPLPLRLTSSSTPAAPVDLRLLSSSADRSLILWAPSPDPSSMSPSASIWTNTRRFGEFSSATNLGFFGALWGPHAKTVLAHGWGGSWHVWREGGENASEEWESVVPVSGHFGTVKSVDWEPQGEYFLTAG